MSVTFSKNQSAVAVAVAVAVAAVAAAAAAAVVVVVVFIPHKIKNTYLMLQYLNKKYIYLSYFQLKVRSHN